MLEATIGQISTASSLTTSDYLEIEQSGVSKKTTLSALSAVIPPRSRGYIDGLTISSHTDTEHDISIAIGTATDSTNDYWLDLDTAIVKQIDATWAAGTGAGGLDTGSVATALTYYVWLIRKDSDASIDALFSASATAPTMPVGYTYKRKIASVITDGSANIIPVDQTNDRIMFRQPVQNRALANIANTNRTAYTASAPPSMPAILSLQGQAASATIYFWYGASTRTDAAASNTNCDMWFFSTGNIGFVDQVKLDTSSQFFGRGSHTDVRFGYFTLGWVDDRGRNQ